MIHINEQITPSLLLGKIGDLWAASAPKILAIDGDDVPGHATPVYTVKGRYTARGWTEWTQGFVYGSAILQFDATGDARFLELGRRKTLERMAHHLTHTGVHDHGFNNVSSYGNLRRLAGEGRFDASEYERHFYDLALKCSGAVQAMRWTRTADGGGFIYSFNGPHSLFADTIRSLRALAVAHELGQVLMGERDRKISLLERLILHARATARYAVYYGEGRDAYDVRGRTAHESLFNVNDGNYRCPSSQQGFAPFTTWTRGLAWILVGFPEELEFLATLDDAELEPFGGRAAVEDEFLKPARATADFYLSETPTDGIPYWDTGAPLLYKLGDYLERPAEPFNAFEPVDSSAAAIAAQGLLRLGKFLDARGDAAGKRYWQAGLTVAETLFGEGYLCTDPARQGLIMHSVYHRPNGWDYVPQGRSVPCGESSMWGDYHARELALLIQREAKGEPYLQFFK